MRRATLTTLFAALTLLSSTSLAETPKSAMLELHVGTYEPAIDEQFINAQPYEDIFGQESATLFGFHADRQVWQGFGSLAVGFGARYGYVTGSAQLEDGSASTDTTELHLLPVTLGLVYRFDVLQERVNMPLVPYGKAGLNYTLWWVFNGRGELANSWGFDGEGHTGAGGTMGWFASGGIQLHLDFFDAEMAAEFDTESGVNNSYLFAEYTMSEVNDFGSAESLELSSDHLSFGLMFEF